MAGGFTFFFDLSGAGMDGLRDVHEHYTFYHIVSLWKNWAGMDDVYDGGWDWDWDLFVSYHI